MNLTSLSFNYATRKYEYWGTDDDGNVVMTMNPKDTDELQVEVPPPIPKHPPKDHSDDACACDSCR